MFGEAAEASKQREEGEPEASKHSQLGVVSLSVLKHMS
jgi:hypothetical protein